MEIAFHIDEHITATLDSGRFAVYILGGWHLSGDKNLEVKVDRPGSVVAVRKKFMRTRRFRNRRRALLCFEFSIDVPGEYFISVRNANQLEMKSSALHLLRMFQKPVSRDQINVLIEQK